LVGAEASSFRAVCLVNHHASSLSLTHRSLVYPRSFFRDWSWALCCVVHRLRRCPAEEEATAAAVAAVEVA
jgi:hypothetical protein